MSLLTKIRSAFVGHPPARRKVPILGVEGSGKSSLIVTLGQFISRHDLGAVSTSGSGNALFGHFLPYVMAGEPFPATTRWDPFALEVQRVPESGGGTTPVDLVLSSEDIPGGDFRHLVNELRQNPNLVRRRGRTGALLRRFTQLIAKSDGFLFMVDLMRDAPAGTRRSNDEIWAAIADQIQPIMTGLLLAAKMNAEMAYKPVFFIFSKPDLHTLEPATIEEYFERGMAVPLAQLRHSLINVRHYNVQCAGWKLESELENLGIGRLLSDLAHAMGAVRAQAS